MSAVQNYAVIDGELVVDGDAGRITLSGALLRRHCRCAQCRARFLRGEEPVAGDTVSVRAVAPMGYGVQIHFSDGHDRGVFPWRHLLDIAASAAA